MFLQKIAAGWDSHRDTMISAHSIDCKGHTHCFMFATWIVSKKKAALSRFNPAI
jgi:hypothetical protein